DAALTASLGLDLEYFGQGDECLIAPGIDEPPGHLLGSAGQLELDEQRGDALTELGRVGGHAAPAMAISASYTSNVGAPISTCGTWASPGWASALTVA